MSGQARNTNVQVGQDNFKQGILKLTDCLMYIIGSLDGWPDKRVQICERITRLARSLAEVETATAAFFEGLSSRNRQLADDLVRKVNALLSDVHELVVLLPEGQGREEGLESERLLSLGSDGQSWLYDLLSDFQHLDDTVKTAITARFRDAFVVLRALIDRHCREPTK
jgi:hypothetical protein